MRCRAAAFAHGAGDGAVQSRVVPPADRLLRAPVRVRGPLRGLVRGRRREDGRVRDVESEARHPGDAGAGDEERKEGDAGLDGAACDAREKARRYRPVRGLRQAWLRRTEGEVPAQSTRLGRRSVEVLKAANLQERIHHCQTQPHRRGARRRGPGRRREENPYELRNANRDSRGRLRTWTTITSGKLHTAAVFCGSGSAGASVGEVSLSCMPY